MIYLIRKFHRLIKNLSFKAVKLKFCLRLSFKLKFFQFFINFDKMNNTSYWTNNTSRSSDRANLLSGGSNSDSFLSTGRKIKHHDINTNNTFEQQNDLRLQDLSSKLSSLHKVNYYFTINWV